MSESEKLIAYVTGTHAYGSGSQFNGGVILAVTGETMDIERGDCGVHLGDWSHLPVCSEIGLMVFEGKNRRDRDHYYGGNSEPDWSGVWRRPTAIELLQLCCPETT